MTLTDEERNAVVALRIERARETLREANGNVEMCYWRTAANRLYYACYYAASALLVKYGHSAQTHTGIIVLLGKHFVATGIISKDMGRFYSRLFDFRQTGDYSDMAVIEPSEVQAFVEPAKAFIETIEKLVKL